MNKISSPLERANFIHHVVDDYNREVFNHPLIDSLSPCRSGCSACCHTQVSITEDEAELLASRVQEGVKIDYSILQKQMSVGNSTEEFFKLSYENRRCVFLGGDKRCLIYNNRPSVCRTNAVLGESLQCSTVEGVNKQELRLVKTSKADMAIMGSFLASKNNGTLAYMLGQILMKGSTKKTPKKKKSICNDMDL